MDSGIDTSTGDSSKTETRAKDTGVNDVEAKDALLGSPADGAAGSSAAYVTTYVETNPDAGQCNYSAMTEQFKLYGSGNGGLLPNPPVTNGEAVGSLKATVSCTVSQSGADFAVNANITVGGGVTVAGGSSFSLSGTTAWPSSETATVTGVTISFGTGGLLYSGTDCTVIYSAETEVPIALGRVWGSFDCADMTESGGSSGTPYVCQGTGTLQLTNCAE
jgi:hypothetical protein